MEPLVSICCAAYNHSKYIAQTLDGFLSQRHGFPIEILVHDDASTDGTAGIIRGYAEKHPDIIRPRFQLENQYSKNIPINETFNFPRSRGKYIALCEGDDYWCDADKLQRQISYMENNPSCTFSFTNGYIHDETGIAPDREFLPYYESERKWYRGKSSRYSLDEIARLSFIPTASFVFRTDALNGLPREFHEKACQHGDLRMKLYLTAAGYAWYEHVYGCVYRENVSGSAMRIWDRESRKQLYDRCRTVVDMVGDVDRYSQGRGHDGLQTVKERYLRVMANSAPNWATLRNGEVGSVYHALPMEERRRCMLRLMLPEAFLGWIAALRKGKKG